MSHSYSFPLATLYLTVRTRPSWPLYAFVTIAKGQYLGLVESKTVMIIPSVKFSIHFLHLPLGCNPGTYSLPNRTMCSISPRGAMGVFPYTPFSGVGTGTLK